MENHHSISAIELFSRNRFLIMLICLLGMLGVAPFVEGFIELRVIMDLFMTVILLSAINAVRTKKHTATIAILLTLPFLASIWTEHFIKISSLSLVGDFFGVACLGFIASVIFIHVLRQHEINREVISGAIVVYLLIGMLWSKVFSALIFIQPGALASAQEFGLENRFTLIYYSFVTMTTLGFGDVIPVSAQAKSFTILEAILGQIYLTILVARLVGINIVQWLEKKPGRRTG
jgi:voltage-gated potassium channel